jgi:uncharacterized protein YqeY
MLQDQIGADWKEAFKAKEDAKKNALNYMIAQIKNKQIEAQRELSDDEVISLIKKEIKSRQEAIDFLQKANKLDDVASEQRVIDILNVYLPAMMPIEELETLVKKTVADLGITDAARQRGEIVKAIMAEHKAVVDGKMLQEVINSL